MLYLLRLIFLNIFFSFAGLGISHVFAEDTVSHGLNNDVTQLLEKAREDAGNMILPINKHAEEEQKSVEQSADEFYSSDFQEKITYEQKRLEKEVFQEYTQSWKEKEPNANKNQAEQTGHLSETEKVYLFLSSSMPDETVHAYLTDIERVADPGLLPITKGLVKGIHDRKAHLKYFSQILKKDLSCRDKKHPKEICQRFKVGISVNPLLFTEYNISRVPAVVFISRENVFKIHGDAGLDYLFERINREAKSTTLASLIKNIQSGGQ